MVNISTETNDYIAVMVYAQRCDDKGKVKYRQVKARKSAV